MAAQQQQAAATTTSTPATGLSLLADSIHLTAETWSAIKRTGACACCAARLVACRNPAVYSCNDRDLRGQLNARFSETNSIDDVVSNEAGERCCPLCLGLLQSEVPLRIAPRPRRSSEVHGDHNRSCEQAVPPMPSQPTPAGTVANTGGEIASLPALTEGIETGSTTSARVKFGETDTAAAAATITSSATAPGNGKGITNSAKCRNTGHSRRRIAQAIAECIGARGYTVSSFGVTAAVPACLVVRNEAFLEAGLGGHHLSPEACQNRSSSADTKPAPATTPTAARSWAVVPVKEALKIGLAHELKTQLQMRQDAAAVVTVDNVDPDFMVEVTAKAPEADAHAATVLLNGPALFRSGLAKPHGWAGGGRWAKKRQRREEQRNPGLTLGAVKTGLSKMEKAGRERMTRWVEGLTREGRGGELAMEEKPARLDGTPVEGDSSSGAADAVTAAGGTVDAESEDPGEAVDGAAVNETEAGGMNGRLSDMAVEAPAVREAGSPLPSDPRAAASSNASTTPPSDSIEALCEVVIRRKSIYFWGRYTKHSRSVPQTPWFKGFFSVQEAVSEPFQEFSGCVEGLLHGAGREDVDVRMLGKGRAFCLELVDSLRSVGEIAARLPSLTDAVNAAGGVKNAGGGVAISSLRVAGPGEFPGDVQAVGEGKRKHYRCVVWVSRPVGKEEVLKTLCDDTPDELVVQQATPIRVLHRRTLLDRPRSIFGMRPQWINEHFFTLDLATSAGTYIKEFVHGDLGRTFPSIGSLLNCRADILQLDVMGIEDTWGAKEDDKMGEVASPTAGGGR